MGWGETPAEYLRQRKRKPVRVSVPYAPTAKGKAAEQRARGHVTVPYAPTPTGKAAERRASGLPSGPIRFRAATTTTGPTADLVNVLQAIGTPPPSLSVSVPSPTEALSEWLDRVRKHSDEPLPGVSDKSGLGAALSTLQLATAGEGGLAAGQRVASGIDAARSAAKAAVKDAVKQAEPVAVQSARAQAAKALERLPQSVRTGARIGARGATLPIKRPFTAPIAAQVPAAVIHGNPAELTKALEGKGTFAALSSGLAGQVGKALPGEAGKLASEAVDLPAVVLPSAFLAGKAGVNAAQGSPAEAEKLLKQWREVGLLPALAEGDGAKALNALKNHPLFSGLEASGALNAVGRGAGALARGATGDRIGGLTREDLPVRGTGVNVKRRYSRDLLRQTVQRAYDRTPHGREAAADTLRGRHYSKDAANRFESGQEAIRKAHIHEDMQALKKTLKGGALPKRGLRLDRKAADVVNLAVERIIRHPETFHEDLQHYKQMIEAASKEVGPDGKPRLDKAQRAANKALSNQIDAALKIDHPGRVEGTVKAANAFIDLQNPILEEMVDLGLLDPQQAATAAATTFARVHHGADFKDGVGLVDHRGDRLSLDQITAEMQRQGIEPPGFLSHRTPGAGDFYQPSFGGANLPKGERTGAAVITGSQLGGIESLVRQLRRSRGLVDRAKSWNTAVSRFGIKVPGVETWSDAQRVLNDPARYGLDPAIQPMAVPRYPFMSKKSEIVGALEHQDPATAGDMASGVLSEALEAAKRGNLAPDTRIAFMPGKVVEQLRAGAEPAGPGLRGFQAATTAFTRTVLPFSPGWYIGNGLDNAIRTGLAGVNPAHFLIGSKVRRSLTPEQEAELLAGAHFSSVGALNPHRSVESLARGYDPLSKGIRSAAEWSRQHGWKQAAVKFGPKMLSSTSNYLVALNSYLTEALPQRGALGKIALAEFRDTQGSWVKALAQQKKLAEDFAKKAEHPDNIIRFQKDLEEVYGNYTRMSPAARKLLRNVSPFWTWFRAAYKFAFLTMPAHHSISTAFLTAAANATKDERESYGLDKMGKDPLPSYMQGAIPLPGGGVFPIANYSSFGYAGGSPAEAVNRLVVPQFRSEAEALAGRDWKGNELPGGEGSRWLSAMWTLATSFVPGAPLLADESEGQKSLRPHINFPHPYDQSYVQYKRQPTQKITVPKNEGSGSSGVDYSNAFGGSGAGEVDYSNAFGGGY